MTDGQKKLFVYDRREMGMLLLLLVGLAVFAFTLGVHLGKKVSGGLSSESQDHGATTSVSTPHGSPDAGAHSDPLKPAAQRPEDRGALLDATQGLAPIEKEALSQELRDEVVRTGLKLEKPVTVNLPTEVKRPAPTPSETHATELPAEKKK